MDLPLKGKVAIVTGGTKGIGKGIADKFSILGAKVVVTARTPVKTKHHYIKCDVCDALAVKKAVDETMKKYKRIDILVNNAGIFPMTMFKDMTPKQWDDRSE